MRGRAGVFCERTIACSVAALILVLGATASGQVCTHPAGHVSFGLFGDANGSGTRNVADAVCVLLGAVAELAGDDLSTVSCLAFPQAADLSCDGTINVSDAVVSVGLSFGEGVPDSLSPTADGCPLACQACAPMGASSCLIGGTCVPEGQRTGTDLCQVCAPATDAYAYSSETCTTYYFDSDGDTYGLDAVSQCACAPIGDFTATQGGDCADDNPQAFPMNPEVCDGADNDCNGTPDDGGVCGPPPLSCHHLHLDDPTAMSGIYTVDRDGAGGDSAIDVYCDMTTDGGGWTLMSKFTQDDGISDLSEARYNAMFRNALWIQGASDGPPATPAPTYDGTDHIESIDWRDVLVDGEEYELRQHFYKNDGTASPADATFDAKWDFTYNGYVSQNAAPEAERAWSLTNRTVLADDTGITWDTDDATSFFWLPFTDPVSGSVYTGCGSYNFSTSGCAMSTASNRRFGNAGIIEPTTSSTDTAASWAPHTNVYANSDIVYVHQSTGAYGSSGSDMNLLYWVREDLCTSDGDCPSGVCGVDHECVSALRSCEAVRDAGQTGDGIYLLDFDGPAGPLAPVQAYCDQTTDGGGWMYVAEPSRSDTDPTDTTISLDNSYHRYQYDLRGKTYDEVLVVRPAGFFWCNSWGTNTTYWGENGETSMGIDYDGSAFNYHNGQTNPYAWIQQPATIYQSCSSCWTANNTTPAPVGISALDPAGSMVVLDPPGTTHSHLEISNFDAVINQAGGCNLTGGNQATWQVYVRGEPDGGVAQLEAGARSYAANSWTPVVFDRMARSEGVTLDGSTLRFSRTGVYRVTFSYRGGAGGDVWTSVRLFGDGATQGLSAGYGSRPSSSPDLFTASFLATVPDIDGNYEIQVGRLGASQVMISTNPIALVALPAVQATVELIDEDLSAPTREYAQLHGDGQTFSGVGWTPATWSSTPLAHGISASGTDLTFSETGVYRVTLSYRNGVGSDVWTAAGLFGDGALKGISAGYGNTANSVELFTTSFLANVDNTTATYNLSLARRNSALQVINTTPILGEALPAVQATITRESGAATSYAQLQGVAQIGSSNQWNSLTFNNAPVAAGITFSGSDITLSEPGIYRVTVSYRQGSGGDVWTSTRLVSTANDVTEGLSAGYGNTPSSPELFTSSFLARVTDTTSPHRVELGRLSSSTSIVDPLAIGGIAPPAVQVTLVKVQ